jgi:uncharacterized protein YqeY
MLFARSPGPPQPLLGARALTGRPHYGNDRHVTAPEPLFATVSGALRAELVDARRAGDRHVAGAIRSCLSALEHAQAVPTNDRGTAIEDAPKGVGSTEVARRDVDDTSTAAIVADEITELEESAGLHDRTGRARDAADLRRAAAVLRGVLDDALG